MNNALALAAVVGPFYFVIGLSLLFYAKSWQRLLEKYEKDHLLFFPFSLFLVILGLIVIEMYNVWSWNLWLLITITGWAMFLKGVFYLLAPAQWIIAIMKLRFSWIFYFGGVICLIIGAALSYPVLIK
jgi:hypothetical protein